jgi:hypothetical protein
MTEALDTSGDFLGFTQTVWFPISLMLASAVMHAVVIGLLKASADKSRTRAFMSLVYFTAALPFTFLVGFPEAGLLP